MPQRPFHSDERRLAAVHPWHDLVGGALEHVAAPRDRGTDLAHFEELVIILRVADGDRVVHRCAQAPERLLEPARLADAVWQHHEPADVEGDGERQTETADDL